MNKKGFIATSLVYSFFLIFITLFLTIIADYLQNKVLLNTIEKGIKEDINSSLGIQDFDIGDKLFFQTVLTIGSVNVPANIPCNITEINYKKSGSSDDTLKLDCNSTEYVIVITNYRLTKVRSNDGYINITGVQ